MKRRNASATLTACTTSFVFITLLLSSVSINAHAQTSEDLVTTNIPNGLFDDSVSEVTTVVCPFKDDIDYEPERLKCGIITVPENREKADSRKIRLLFAHIVASAGLEEADSNEDEEIEVREDPVVYLTGGPGVNIEPYVKRFLAHDLTKSRDLYILNQRGIGDSGELCPFFSATSRENITAASLEESEVQEAQRTKACFDAASARGIDLSAYNTVENARDVRALRRALGFEQWNVWGISYGSHLGQMLTQIDPQGIRALVVDAIVPNDLGDLMRIHRWIARNHTLIFDECERQDASICDGLKERFYAAFNSIVDKPIAVPALDNELYPSGSVNVPSILVGFAPFAMQYEQDEHPAIPAVMQALSHYAEERDEEIFQAFVSTDEPFSGSSAGMGDAIRCNDGYVAAQAQIAEQDLQEMVGFKQGIFTVDGARMMAQMCEEAGLAPRDRRDYQLVQTDIPTLIVNGDWDPITPPPLAERISPGFSNGRLIIVPYAGHGPTRSMPECAAQVMTDFFDAPNQNLNELDASCLEEGVEAPEFLTYVSTDAALRMLARATDDPKRLAFPVVYSMLLVSTIGIGFLAIIYGVITRRFSTLPNPYLGTGTSRMRMLGFASAFFALLGLALVGAGVAQTIEISEISIVAGIAPPAQFGAWSLIVSAVMSLLTLYEVFMANKTSPLRRRTMIGLPLIAISSLLLLIYLMAWGISPW